MNFWWPFIVRMQMVLVKIDQKSPVPIYEQIYRQIIALIETGSLLIGSRLPASRDLAQKAGVNRSTVYRAYQELWALGYIESRPGSYSTVRRRTDIVRLEDGPRSSVIDWDEASSLPSRRLHGEYAHFSKHQPPVKQDHLINFSRLSADLELCPVDDFRRSVKQALVRNGKGILAYGDHAGYPPLRESIAARMRIHGVSVTPDEIMITNGAQHGIDLALRLLASPGTQIVTEVPIYGIALPLFRFHGVEMIEIPMGDDGMIRHPAEGVNHNITMANQFAHSTQKICPIRIIEEDRHPSHASGHDMIHRPLEFNPGRATHGPSLPGTEPAVKKCKM